MAVTDTLRRTSVSWYVALPEFVADRTAPTADELNGALVYDVTCALDEDSTTMDLGDSDTDDRYSFCSEAGIDKPTNYNPTVELGVYRDADRTATGTFADAFNLFHFPDVPLYIIKRVGDQSNVPGTAIAVGDKISMFYVKTDFPVDALGLDDPAMFTTTPLPQGFVLWQYTVQA